MRTSHRFAGRGRTGRVLTRDLGASIALDETTRECAAYVCSDFVRHADVAIRGRTGRFDVYALPLRAA